MNFDALDAADERWLERRKTYALIEADEQKKPWTPPTPEVQAAMTARELGKPRKKRRSRSMWS